ncbi:hypothetical protein L249_7051 [Ophiocordyceps polyrhachis-furcata BCC 54312]|uniref:Uncharacterized protein n=1 Tax=Ophiocordyceps polyrhachis-furcata BCC 54312 TaxID=1330021 RepID=A0A367LJH3_9HYPO|nr:hypothetical protein L249_7051 [Ophiocordyceps polyrhachis-furcata BCC 54312]
MGSLTRDTFILSTSFFTAFLFTFRPTNYFIRTQLDPLFLKKFPLSATIGNDQKYSFAKLSGSGNYTY